MNKWSIVAYFREFRKQLDRGEADLDDISETLRTMIESHVEITPDIETAVRGMIDYFGRKKETLPEGSDGGEALYAIDSVCRDLNSFLQRKGKEKRTYEIRPPFADKQDELDLIENLNKLLKRELYGVLEGSLAPKPEIEEGIEWKVLAAFWDDIPIGAIWYGIVEPSFGGYIYLSEVYSHREHRERGLGVQLISQMIRNEYEAVQEGKIDRVVLHSVEAALDFYMKLGFFGPDEPVFQSGDHELVKMVLPLTKDAFTDLGTPGDIFHVVYSVISQEVAAEYVKNVAAGIHGDADFFPFDTSPFLFLINESLNPKKPL